jgi:WD40 repeat protein
MKLVASGFPDRQILATAGSDKVIYLWALDGTLLATLDRHTAQVQRLAFSPDGRFLFSASTDKTIIRWDLNAVLQLNPLNYACNWVSDYLRTNVEISPEDRTLCEDL